MGKYNNKKKTPNKKMGFSKKILIADYFIAAILLVAFFICVYANGSYVSETTNMLVEMGVDASLISVSPPYNLDVFGVLLGAWIAQLGLSSGAYYMMAKSEHKIQLPIQLVNDLPKEIKEQVDMTQIITSVLSCTDN